jgi:hypothetical protein
MKKVVWLAAAAGVAYLAWKQAAADRADRQLWADVTDPVQDIDLGR